MHLNDQGTAQLPFDVVAAVVQRSSAAWANHPCSFMHIELVGSTSQNQVGPTDSNNLVIFRDEAWPHLTPVAENVLALTSVTCEFTTGEIVDADIEFNSAKWTFPVSDDPASTIIDLENTMVHEFGHVLGFDHSPDVSATMHLQAPPGELEKHSAAQDDIDALCNSYPLANPNGLTCAEEGIAPDGCCAISRRRPGAPNLAVLLVAGLLWCVRRRG